MPKIRRTANVVWEGNLARGTGTITAATGAFEELPYSMPTRVGNAEGKTSPEELLAGAHAGCFAMSLTGELTGRGTPPERLEVACEILMDEVEGQGHQIVASTLTVSLRPAVEGLDALVAAADEGCTFSALLKRAGATVTVDAHAAA